MAPASTPWVLPCITSTEPNIQIGTGSSKLGGHRGALLGNASVWRRCQARRSGCPCSLQNGIKRNKNRGPLPRVHGWMGGWTQSSRRHRPCHSGDRQVHTSRETSKSLTPSYPPSTWASWPRSATSGTPSTSVATFSMFGYVLQQCPLLFLPPSAPSGFNPSCHAPSPSGGLPSERPGCGKLNDSLS